MMTFARPSSSFAISCAPLAVLLMLGAAAPARAQGTPEQREACAPDAVKLCPDTIPDEEPTKACMQRHIAELSRRCRKVFEAATAVPAGPAERAGGAPAEAAPAAAAPAGPMDSYRATIAENCRKGLIDSYTCRNTLGLLNGE